MLEIVKRAERMELVDNRMTSLMDLTACHGNGTPLQLAALLGSADGDFIHDFAGIKRHIDRDTGQLKDCFLPRYAALQIKEENK